jgi:5'-3' exonuclease
MSTELPEPGADDVLWVFDLSGLVHKFWHATGPWAARNVADLFRRFVEAQQPKRVAIAEDLPFPTFRHDLMAEWGMVYKGTRPDRGGNEKGLIAEQMRHASELAEDAYGFARFVAQGFEADDIAATLTKQALAEGLRVVVVAADKDMCQLVDDDEQVILWNGKLTGKERLVSGPPEVHQRLGVWPWQVVDYLSLVGDTSDAVPGVKGIGEESAAKILAEFKTLDRAFAEAAKGRTAHPFWSLPYHGRIWSALAGDPPKQAAARARRLIELRQDVPLARNLESTVI